MVYNAFFCNCWKKNLKKFAEKKSFSVFEGTPFKPFKHTMTFFLFNLIFNIHKNAFDTNSRIFRKNMHVIKKKEVFDALFWRDH